ncbi:MAG: CBS domain-containing protein [Oscillospiraceae bacterium]
MNICDIMSDHVISICEDEPVCAAARLLKHNNIGALPVRDEKGKLRGIITDRDIVLRCVAAEADAKTLKVSEIMSRNLITASPLDDAEKSVCRMAEAQVRRLPITEGGVLVGIVALGDVARRGDFEMEAAEALCEISSNFRRR